MSESNEGNLGNLGNEDDEGNQGNEGERLLAAVRAFRAWARTFGADSAELHGEWEINYGDWEDAYEDVAAFLRAVPLASATSEQLDALFYLIARDNECETIGEELLLAWPPGDVIELAERALLCLEQNTRWQLAARLGDVTVDPGASPDRVRLLAVLTQLSRDADEHVRRRSLAALATHGFPRGAATT